MSYDPGLGEQISVVRFELGDHLTENVPDTTISAILAVEGGSTLKAAARIAWHFHARYAHQVDERQVGPGDVSSTHDFAARAKRWREIYDSLLARARRVGGFPVATGTKADNEAARIDESIIQPLFANKMFDNTESIDSASIDRDDGDCPSYG